MKCKVSPVERAALRKQGLAFAKLVGENPATISTRCGLPLARCRYLVAMADFQTLASVGPAAAQDLWDLGYRSLSGLANGNPVDMYNELCLMVGSKLDPCVEDVFRCAIAQVRDPHLPAERANWWYWKPMRGAPMGDAHGAS